MPQSAILKSPSKQHLNKTDSIYNTVAINLNYSKTKSKENARQKQSSKDNQE